MSLLMFELSPALLRWSARWPSCSTTVKSYLGLPQSCFDQPGGMPFVPTGMVDQSSTTGSAAWTATATNKPKSAVIRTPARAFMRSPVPPSAGGSRTRAGGRGSDQRIVCRLAYRRDRMRGGPNAMIGDSRKRQRRSARLAAENGERGLRLRDLRGFRRDASETRALVERRHPGERRARRGAEAGDPAAELPRGLAG